MTELTVVLPIYWTQEFVRKKDKTHLIGMNNYHNWHHRVTYQFKLWYTEVIEAQLATTTPFVVPNQFKVHYKVFHKRRCDISNIVPLIEKVFLDTINKNNIIQEDNVEFHIASSWEAGGKDKLNPRVEITVIPIKEIE